MDNKNLFKLYLRRALTALAIGFGTVSYLNSDAIATPIKNNFQLAQVGVRSRVTPPTPLNLRPRSHTPLPRSNSSYYPYRSYPRSNTRYGHRQHDHHHGDYNHSQHRHTHKSRRRNRSRVIIISPGNHSGYRNYSNSGSYIRVIGK